ncbi:hypothetical protein OA14_20360, partial [Vibrio vulnificus]
MHQREAINYVTVEELEKDFESLTGDKESAKAQVKLFAIRYRGEIIDSVRYQKGLISKDDLLLSKHIRWQHHKNHSQRLAANMLAANRKRPA